MYSYESFVVMTLLFVTIAMIILSLLNKKRLKQMSTMTLSMVTGMNVGLTIGVLFGLIFQGNLFHSTLLSISAAVLAGALTGLTFGTISLLEGIFSGLMSGMMGAMLGDMITVQQGLTFINIFLSLSVSSLLLFQILPVQLDKLNMKQGALLKPVMVFLIILIYLLVGTTLSEKPTPLKNHEEHSNHTKQSYGTM